MDLDGLTRVLERMARGDIETVAVETPEPSPFSHEILNANPYAYLDDAPLEERRTRAVQLRRTPADRRRRRRGRAGSGGHPQVAEESWPDVRDADELHDALLTLILLPPVERMACSTIDELGARWACIYGAAAIGWRPNGWIVNR